jgi:Zn finger protein HypA/HybF involved in hydrogenase expression
MSEAVNIILNEKRVFLCTHCNDYKVLPSSSLGCPDCGDELEMADCIKCDQPATRLETFMVGGEAPGRFAYEVDEPRCGAH